jgi:protein-S-isoprenylcysteine O-methyltransferase Ste14
MNVAFTIIFLIFMIIMSLERVWETFLKGNRKSGKIIKGWTLWVLTTFYVIVIGGTVIEYFVLKRIINPFITCLGFSMYLTGLVFRNWAIKSLGEYHSAHIEIRGEHLLVRDGAYQYLRHPIYLGIIIEILGIPLIPNAYYALLLAISTYLPLLFLRMYWEEQIMVDKFGEKYFRYRKEVWGLLPIKKKVKK